MSESELNITGRTDVELFVAAFVLHSAVNCGSTVQGPLLQELLSNAPFDLDARAIDGVIQRCREELGALQLEESESPEDTIPHYSPTEALVDATSQLFEELRKRSKPIPSNDASLILLSESIERNEIDFDTVTRCLSEPPAQLDSSEASALLDQLRSDGWLCVNGDLFLPSPTCIAWEKGIRERLIERAESLHANLAKGVADSLDLAPDAPLRDALNNTRRAHFVSEEFQHLAYRNLPRLIMEEGSGQSWTTTSAPAVCATIANALEIKSGDRVLICNVKGGFTAALCAHLAGAKGRVVCIESDPFIREHAERSLQRVGLGPDRCQIKLVDDVTIGLESEGPWDAVVINGGIPTVPYDILDQMNDDGRLLIFVHDVERQAQKGCVIKKNNDVVDREDIAHFSFTPIYGKYGWADLNRLKDQYAKARARKSAIEIDEAINRSCPYPLARAYHSAKNTGQPFEFHKRILKSFEYLVRFLVFPLFALRDRAFEERRMGPSEQLQLAVNTGLTFGRWKHCLVNLSRELQAEHPWVAKLESQLHEPRSHSEWLEAMKHCQLAINPDKPFQKQKISFNQLLDQIVAYRNSSPDGHGPIVSNTVLERRAQALLNCMGRTLCSFKPLAECDLYWIERIERQKKNDINRGMRLLLNPTRHEIAPKGRDRIYEEMVIWQPPEGDFINLDPWCVYRQLEASDEREFFMFDCCAPGSENSRLYSTAHNSLTHPPKEDIPFKDIRERHKIVPETIGRNHLDYFNKQLDDALQDRHLTREELSRLIGIALGSQLVGDQFDAERWVIDRAKQLLPEVTIESEARTA